MHTSIHWVALVSLVISITFHDSSLFVRSHTSFANRDKRGRNHILEYVFRNGIYISNKITSNIICITYLLTKGQVYIKLPELCS